MPKNLPLALAYRRLDSIQHLPRNPKQHDVGAIVVAMREFGVLDPIAVNERTGHDLDGNGRLKALRAMMAENRRRPPRGVRLDQDGMWLIPVVTGIRLSPMDEERAAIALNRVQDLGGYDNTDLLEVLSDLASADRLEGTGYDGDDVDALFRKLNKPEKAPPVQPGPTALTIAACLDCGKPYGEFGLDTVLSDDQWALIMGQPDSKDDPGGLLCGNCIVARASRLGYFVRARLVLE